MLVHGFVSFGQNQATHLPHLPLIPLFMSSQGNQLEVTAAYLPHTHMRVVAVVRSNSAKCPAITKYPLFLLKNSADTTNSQELCWETFGVEQR